VRTRGACHGRGRTVTCEDGRGWTCCRQMACKRSAVRARLAPLVSSEIRTDRTASTAAKYSHGGRAGRRTCVRIRHLLRQGCWTDSGFLAPDRCRSASELGKSLFRGPVTLAARPPDRFPGRPFLIVAVVSFACGQPRCSSERSGPPPAVDCRRAALCVRAARARGFHAQRSEA
jgi:hypothetical protein